MNPAEVIDEILKENEKLKKENEKLKKENESIVKEIKQQTLAKLKRNLENKMKMLYNLTETSIGRDKYRIRISIDVLEEVLQDMEED